MRSANFTQQCFSPLLRSSQQNCVGELRDLGLNTWLNLLGQRLRHLGYILRTVLPKID